jgi:hypothetical protein
LDLKLIQAQRVEVFWTFSKLLPMPLLLQLMLLLLLLWLLAMLTSLIPLSVSTLLIPLFILFRFDTDQAVAIRATTTSIALTVDVFATNTH